MKMPPETVMVMCSHCGGNRRIVNWSWLRRKRLDAGITLREMARRLGLSAAYVSDIERGNRHAFESMVSAYRALVPR